MMIIESSIPIPEKMSLRNPLNTAAIAGAMEIGDSVLFPEPKDARALVMAGGRLGLKFARRQVEGGARVWRLA